MKNDYEFDMPESENRYILKLKLVSKIEERKYYIRKGEFTLEPLKNINKGEIEITRFITREGAELRNDYQNFYDLRRDFNLLELINTKYSSNHEMGTLHPTVTKLWGLDASKKENLNIFDINFYVMCLQGVVEREVINSYINIKLNLKRHNYTNEELYENLLKILRDLGNERQTVEKKRITFCGREIFLDIVDVFFLSNQEKFLRVSGSVNNPGNGRFSRFLCFKNRYNWKGKRYNNRIYKF